MKRRLFVVIVCSLLVAFGEYAAVFADPADLQLSPEQLTIIAQNCPVAQSQLRRVQGLDAVTRTNRVRQYDAILKYMAAFNSRAALNKLNATKITSVTNDLQGRVQQLRDDFTRYNGAMNNVTGMSCQSQPDVFYAALTEVRGLRVQLAGDVRELDAVVDGYQAAVNDLRVVLAKKQPGNTP